MLIGRTRTHRQIAAVLPEEPVEEARMQRGRVPLVDRDVRRAEALDQARDEGEDLDLAVVVDEAGELGAEELVRRTNVSGTERWLDGRPFTHLQEECRREGGEDEVAVWRRAHIACGDQRLDQGSDDCVRGLVALGKR